MKLDFEGTLNLVLCPSDLRLGYKRLASLANEALGIDVSKGKDWVVFISTKRNTAKIIHCDNKGSVMICRKLHEGVFQWLTAPANGPAMKTMDKDTLLKYLDGETIEIKRKNLLKN